jgi:hypothetical protein
MSALFEARATKERVLHLRECVCRIPFVNRMALVHALAKMSIELIVIYFHSFEIFIIQIGEVAFYKPDYIIIK